MKKFLLSLISILSFGIILSGCEKLDTSEPILIAPNFINYVTTVNFTSDVSDSATGIIDSSMDNTIVTVSGPDADKVYNLQGKKEFKIVSGSVQLMLGPNAKFTNVSEYNVNITVAPNGFLKRIIPVKFTKETQTRSLVIAMLNESNLPAGATLVKKTGTINASTGLTSPVSIVASNATNQGLTTTVSLPAGIKMKDASGNIVSGALEAKVISFDDTAEMSKFFPGGAIQDNVVLKGGEVGSGIFQIAGFASVTMTAGGSSVKSFEGGAVTIKITLGKDSFNYDQNRAYKAGDIMDVSSYDTTLGQWKYESEATVQKDTNNTLFVSFTTTHLSMFSPGKMRIRQAPCTGSFQLGWNNSQEKIYVKIQLISNGSVTNENDYNLSNDQIIALSTNSSIPYTMKVFNNNDGKLLFEKSYNNLCDNNISEILTIQAANPEVTLRYGTFCPKKGITFLPPVGVRVDYREQGQTEYRTLHTVDANNSTKKFITTNLLQVGKTYDFKVTFGGLVRTKTQKIEKNDMLFENVLLETTCNQL